MSLGNNSVIGFLEFDYPFMDYTYVNTLDVQYSEYREVTDIYAKGTNIVIGSLNIFTTMTLRGEDVYGEVEHLYSLPEGIIKVVYTSKNTMSTQGEFLPNETYYTALNSGSSGDFLGSCGTAEVKIHDTEIRSVRINFYKDWTYPFN